MKLATVGDEAVGCAKFQEKEAWGLTELDDNIADLATTHRHIGMPTGVDWVVITEGGKPGSQGKVYKDMGDQLREAYEDIVLETVRADVWVPEVYTAAQSATLDSPSTAAAETYTKIGRQMKLYR